MRATFKVPARIPLAGWSPAARADAEAELRAKAVELALGAGADIEGPVEVAVTWQREDELWRDPDDHDARLQTRTVMAGAAVLEAELPDDVAEAEARPGLVTLGGDAAAVVYGGGPGAVRLESGEPVTALSLDAERRASPLVCGQPERRHSFPRHEAIAMSEGMLTSSVCGDCGRRVSRDELLRNAELEGAGVAWWTA